MKYKTECILSYFIILISIFIAGSVFANVTVNPPYVFLNSSNKTSSITVRNPGEISKEISIEISYGYVVSDDSGKPNVVFDSLSDDNASAAKWIRAYPQRFYLGANESQIVRIIASPPPGLNDGEYWARVIIIMTPDVSIVKKEEKKLIYGMTFKQGISIPVYFRNGGIVTGLDIHDFAVNSKGEKIICSFTAERTGNAAYQGSCSIRILDAARKLVKRVDRSLIVFKTFSFLETIELGRIASGKYTVDIEINTKKATKKSPIIEADPIRFSQAINIF